MEEKQFYTVDEMAQVLGVSRPVAYQLTRKKGFPAVRVSAKRIIVPIDALHKWLSSQSVAKDGD